MQSSERRKSWDVIVVGAGGSGLAAGCAAAQQGASALVLEKEPQPGGTTGIAVGSFTAAETQWQRSAGVADSVADHVADLPAFAPPELEARNNAELRSFFLGESAATLHWLKTLGLSFVGPNPEPPNRAPRMHNVVPGAKAYIAALQMALRRHNGALRCGARVEQLLRQGRRVTGVQVTAGGRTERIEARGGVILAGGDYANNPDMIAEHKGERFRDVEGINPRATGEAHQLAAAAGAQMLNMDVTYGPELRFVAGARRPFQQWLPASGPLAQIAGWIAPRLPPWVMRRMIKRLLVTWQHPEDALFDDGAILINASGRRFVNERTPLAREIAVAQQPEKRAYLLLGARLSQKYSAWPHFVSTAPDIAYAYVQDYIRLRPDVARRGDDLSDLARRRQLDPAAVADAVGRFNQYAQGQSDDPWGRTGDAGHLLDGPPWTLLGPVKAYFTTTEGGALVNSQLQVLDHQRQFIPGLYAVGQTGLGGMILWSHGLHIAWALTSGRLAGRNAAAAAGAPRP